MHRTRTRAPPRCKRYTLAKGLAWVRSTPVVSANDGAIPGCTRACRGMCFDSRPAAVEAYLVRLEDLESGNPDGSIEGTFAAGAAVPAALAAANGDETCLESLGPERFEALGNNLRGILVNREEIVLAGPAPSFFLALSSSYGQAVDVEFFQPTRCLRISFVSTNRSRTSTVCGKTRL